MERGINVYNVLLKFPTISEKSAKNPKGLIIIIIIIFLY